jgi:hypothetical protein
LAPEPVPRSTAVTGARVGAVPPMPKRARRERQARLDDLLASQGVG